MGGPASNIRFAGNDEVPIPAHLRLIGGQLDELASIPFHSLCKGLLLPLSGMHPQKAAHLFHIGFDPPPDAAGREALIRRFLDTDVGLSVQQKLACLLGDPFQGAPGTLRRDSMIALLMSMELTSRRALLDRLARVGEIAVLFAQNRPTLRSDPGLTACEVFETLRLLPPLGRNRKLALLRSLLQRCGKLEAYFLARLTLRRAGLGVDYHGPLIARALADQYDAPADQVAHAMALTDAFAVAGLLADKGVEGLRQIRLQPLVPVRPALASGGRIEDIRRYPVWVERKYDGIRLMLHKSTDTRGTALCGAYTRGRGDWLESVPGLDATIKLLPARSVIVDGELHGTRLTAQGPRPAGLYDLYSALQGDGRTAVQLRYAAFDLIYLEGADLTGLPLSQRRDHLRPLIAPLATLPLPVPLSLAEGQLADGPEHVKRLYGHFRQQGYEGVIAKDLQAPYQLGARDPTWLKRKPQVTLDLVILAGVLAVTTKERTGMFGSYVLGARRSDGTFEDVGDVAGLDTERDLEIQREIMREGLLTGRRIERQAVSGVRPGFELRPHLVVTVKLTEIKKSSSAQGYSLRDPKVLAIRADKSASEADEVAGLEQLYLRQQVG